MGFHLVGDLCANKAGRIFTMKPFLFSLESRTNLLDTVSKSSTSFLSTHKKRIPNLQGGFPMPLCYSYCLLSLVTLGVVSKNWPLGVEPNRKIYPSWGFTEGHSKWRVSQELAEKTHNQGVCWAEGFLQGVLDSQVIFMSSLVYRRGRILPYLAIRSKPVSEASSGQHAPSLLKSA